VARGRYPARLNVSPPPPELAARYLRVWPGHELYAGRAAFPAVSSPSLFGDDHPLELDLGCATGDLVLALAATRPEANYVGVDIVGKPLWRAVERAAQAGLGNVQFVQADARLVYDQIPDRALRAAYVHFPAPMLRTSQRKGRLLSAAMLAAMERCLRPGGMLSVMTDQPALFAELHALLPAAPALAIVPPEQWSVAMTELVKSHYHKRWEERGRPILRAELLRLEA
jgi:tRNA (guanine-N7-)-methyltransferase